ncbi:MAG: sigma-54-dependent Fis family transcriptional regulator [Planctomycetes bacterium]|nr:sigma-54-dependent Fis family transcriptional regulator [Planctomycetota bacterium]
MKQTGAILLVDDEAQFRENVADYLDPHGYMVLQAGDAESALSQAHEHVLDAALVDILMPGMDGITLLSRLKEIDSHVEVIIVTGQASVESAVDAMRRGAFHYVTKPVRLHELEMLVERAVEKTQVSRQNVLLREDLRRKRAQAAGEIVAASDAMKTILTEAESVAKVDSSVLIEGETGVGKEVVAEFIHRNSKRGGNVFCVLNCGALPETLQDAELFGYEKGAFTGAAESRPGIIEVSNGGTLLLDEIGDIPPGIQTRFLRFLERGLVRRLGSTREQSVDVRILAATHRSLEQEVAEGRFREDLYHRLLVFRLHIPPLRERTEDILPLAEHFVFRVGAPGTAGKTMSRATQDALLNYCWPGNVRELAHSIERACFAAQLARSDEILPEHLGLPDEHGIVRSPIPARASALGAAGSGVDLSETLDLSEIERKAIQLALAKTSGDKKRAAQLLNIGLSSLYRKIKEYGFD